MGDPFFRIRALTRLQRGTDLLAVHDDPDHADSGCGVSGLVAGRLCRTDRRVVAADCQSAQITRRDRPLDPGGHEGRMSRQTTATRYKVKALVSPHRLKTFIYLLVKIFTTGRGPVDDGTATVRNPKLDGAARGFTPRAPWVRLPGVPLRSGTGGHRPRCPGMSPVRRLPSRAVRARLRGVPLLSGKAPFQRRVAAHRSCAAPDSPTRAGDRPAHPVPSLV
jgi:hypothetical protein